MTPVAIIPMVTPEEAIDELDYAVTRRRLQGGDAAELREAADRSLVDRARSGPLRWRADTFGIDSEHDYDPVWAKCRELGVVPSLPHSRRGLDVPRLDLQPRLQPRRALRQRGNRDLQVAVPRRREPAVPRAAVPLPRGRCRLGPVAARRSHGPLGEAQPRRTRPRQRSPPRRRRPLPRPLPSSTADRCGGETTAGRAWRGGGPSIPRTRATASLGCRSRSTDELRRLFVERFYFGCEGDDPVMPSAFDAAATRGAPAARDLRLRHRPLGRPADGRGARRGVRAARGRDARRR